VTRVYLQRTSLFRCPSLDYISAHRLIRIITALYRVRRGKQYTLQMTCAIRVTYASLDIVFNMSRIKRYLYLAHHDIYSISIACIHIQSSNINYQHQLTTVGVSLGRPSSNSLHHHPNPKQKMYVQQKNQYTIKVEFRHHRP
jgi:hypothetical protein